MAHGAWIFGAALYSQACLLPAFEATEDDPDGASTGGRGGGGQSETGGAGGAKMGNGGTSSGTGAARNGGSTGDASVGDGGDASIDGGEPDASAGGNASTGGNTSIGGNASTGGVTSTGGATSTGGSVPATPCDAYCDLQEAKCTFTGPSKQYASRAACLSGCAAIGTGGADGDTSGNNLQCRVSHLKSITDPANTTQTSAECPETGPSPPYYCQNHP